MHELDHELALSLTYRKYVHICFRPGAMRLLHALSCACAMAATLMWRICALRTVQVASTTDRSFTNTLNDNRQSIQSVTRKACRSGCVYKVCNTTRTQLTFFCERRHSSHACLVRARLVFVARSDEAEEEALAARREGMD
jgi:hypothetical protein